MQAADSVQAVVRDVFSKPEYQWHDAFDPQIAFWRVLWSISAWLDRLRSQSPLAYKLLIAGLVVTLIGILAHAVWVASRTIARATAAESGGIGLAVAPPRDARWYAEQAARFALTGRYVEAMHADFMRLLLELDARKAIRFHPSKTPREYLADRGLTEQARRALGDVIRQLYAHAFAGVPCDERSWSAWRERTRSEGYAAAQ